MQAATDSEESLCHLVDFSAALQPSERISAPPLDWHTFIPLSSTGITLKGRIPWRLRAGGGMPGSRQALVSLIETSPKIEKDPPSPHSAFRWLARPLRATFPSLNVSSQNHLRHLLTGVSAPALTRYTLSQSFLGMTDSQMLCKSICLHLHITVHVNTCRCFCALGPFITFVDGWLMSPPC